MRHAIPAMTFLLAAFAAACTPVNGHPATEPKDLGSASAQGDKAVAETREAIQAMQDYTWAQKAEFVDKMKIELIEIQDELDRLSGRVDRASGAAKVDAKTSLDAAREKWAQARKQLDRAEDATESTWDDVKNGFRKSRDELKGTFMKTRQWLADKIEP